MNCLLSVLFYDLDKKIELYIIDCLPLSWITHFSLKILYRISNKLYKKYNRKSP